MDDCPTCRYSGPHVSDVPSQGPILKCHRYPPILLVLNDEPAQVNPDAAEWCGEYRPDGTGL